LVGQLNKFEIWNESAWTEKENELMMADDVSVSDLEELSSLSF
jgi:MraZ protein